MTDRPRALAVLIAVFLLGCILGSSGSFYWLRRPTEIPRGTRDSYSRPMPEGQRLPEFLKMTPDQEARYREIMAESRRQLEALRAEQAPMRRQLEEMRSQQTPKIEAILSEANSKLMAVLNEEQKKKFSEFINEMRKWRERAPRGRDFEAPRGRDFAPPRP